MSHTLNDLPSERTGTLFSKAFADFQVFSENSVASSAPVDQENDAMFPCLNMAHQPPLNRMCVLLPLREAILSGLHG